MPFTHRIHRRPNPAREFWEGVPAPNSARLERLEPRGFFSAQLTTLANFSGGSPLTSDAKGNLYAASGETVYEVEAGSHEFRRLASLASFPASQSDSALVLDAAGNLYGAANAAQSATVYEISARTRKLTALAIFNQPYDLSVGGLAVDSEGNLYGTADASVFEIASGSSRVRTLFQLRGNGTTSPNNLVRDAANNLYFTAGGGRKGVTTG